MHRLLLLALLLPVTLFADDDLWDEDDWSDEEETSQWTGFVEAGLGTRFDSDPLIDDDSTLQELRLRLESEWLAGKVTFGFKADAAYDGVVDDLDLDVRDLSAAWSIGNSTDIRVGRQVQTWGTGDLVFLNDLFPKDFVSFFAGRDDEYLKAPGDAIRITHFSPAANIDFVWTPVFEPDVYLTGERFSFFSPQAGMNVAPQPPFSAEEPEHSLQNGEFALRLFRTIEGREYAVYAYHGFFKQPGFAPLTSLGASLRQPLGPGLFNAETSYYLSRDDRSGTDPTLPNDQLRVLFGYEWEARPNFNIALQYYLERTMDHDDLMRNSPTPQFEPDENRHLLTNRLTYRAGRDKHTWSLFTFYSPSDRDLYARPVYGYRHDDRWEMTAGANLFAGKQKHTFFAQLQDASNAYLRIRFNY
jgi:hypothetical protein